MTPAKILAETSLLKRFLTYVQMDTQAQPGSTTFPSNPKEKELAQLLAGELRQLDVRDVQVSEFGYVYAHIPGNCGAKTRLAFLAHMDVAPDCKGEGVQPQVHPHYDGKDIGYSNGDKLSIRENPEMLNCVGQTLITSDGTTLLGADNKAGVAAIMSFVEYAMKHPEISRPDITVCFTPDEEIGAGVDHIEIDKLRADLAFTVDGGLAGEINLETFTAWGATVSFVGKSHHPGSAKGNMVHGLRSACKFVAMLPEYLASEHTEGREPFIHPTSMDGNVEKAEVKMILRAFSDEGIAYEKSIIDALLTQLKTAIPGLEANVVYKEQYRNMGEIINQNPLCQQLLQRACEKVEVPMRLVPIRGGTDGARLSFQGIPTPNVYAGGANFHSVHEWASLEHMASAAALLTQLALETASQKS